MDEYVFGANILENLTTGMYKDSRVIYREYIQNACDQIDKACAPEYGLLQHKSDGSIEIWIDPERRVITIEDNATGIPANKFQQTLANIADSDKRIGEDKGFRGIGRLCGLAYCKELVFTSKAAGEPTVSIMKCAAERMRTLITLNQSGNKRTAGEVLHEIYSFSEKPADDVDEHWFRVELIGINEENRDLLDAASILEYLSFVAPVPYQNKFIFRRQVYEHAAQIGCPIDEYMITLNGEQIFKRYGTHFKTSKGDDEIFQLAFHDFFDSDGMLIAWSWFGVSKFKAVINKDCLMRGLRPRKENIQIGGDDALQKLFKEDRGHHYFIGEVFAVAKDLLPNSQRDYFNENNRRVAFERLLRIYFNEELRRIYYDGSSINSAFAKIENLVRKEEEFQRKADNGDYIDEMHRQSAAQDVERARAEALRAEKELERLKTKATQDPESVVGLIISRIETQRTSEDKFAEDALPPEPDPTRKPTHRSDKLSRYTKNERKLISRIFSIILSATDEATAEKIIKKIEDELK